MRSFRGVLCLILMLLGGAVRAEDIIRIAVDTDFKPVIDELTALYTRTQPARFIVTDGASAELYNQIRTKARFDIFLSADVTHPERLERGGVALPDTRRTYAIGRQVEWRPKRLTHGKPQITTLAKVRRYERLEGRSFADEIRIIDPNSGTLLEQQMILLRSAGNSVNNPASNEPAARAFWQFIQSEPAQRLIAAAGYRSPTWIDPNCHGCTREDAVNSR